MKPKTILGVTDYGTSGLAYTLRLPLAHWHEQGHNVWLLANGFDGDMSRVDRTMYPYAERLIRGDGPQPFVHRELPSAVAMVQPDVVLTGMDLWLLNHTINPEYDAVYAGDPLARFLLRGSTRHYTHLAAFPLENLLDDGSLPRYIEENIGKIDMPICYSRFSKDAILRSTGLDIPLIPLPVDPKVFYPRDPAPMRARFGVDEDIFFVSMVGTNQWRKLWGEFIEVMGRMTKRHKNIRILPWTSWNYRTVGGADLRDLFYRHDLGPFLVDPGDLVGRVSDNFMAELYSAIDVLVLTTAAEGAGLPPLHARACGTPALVSANTSNTEFAAHPFELIPSRPNGLVHGFFGLPNTVVYKTDIDVLEARLEELYADRALREEIGEAGRSAMRAYAPENIFPLWDRVLESAVGQE